MVIGSYRQALTTVSSAEAEGRGSCQPQPESPSALFTVIKQHNIGHLTPQIKPHYIKEILDLERQPDACTCQDGGQDWMAESVLRGNRHELKCVYPPTLSEVDMLFTILMQSSHGPECVLIGLYHLHQMLLFLFCSSLIFRK